MILHLITPFLFLLNLLKALTAWNEVQEEYQTIASALMEKVHSAAWIVIIGFQIKVQQAEQYKKQKYGGGAKGGTKPPDIWFFVT